LVFYLIKVDAFTYLAIGWELLNNAVFQLDWNLHDNCQFYKNFFRTFFNNSN
jgi:hypothetical protein